MWARAIEPSTQGVCTCLHVIHMYVYSTCASVYICLYTVCGLEGPAIGRDPSVVFVFSSSDADSWGLIDQVGAFVDAALCHTIAL